MARMSVDVELEKGEVSKYRRHENGRGLVSPSARVNPSAYVSSAAYVESDAQIGPGSWIGQGSWIDRGAFIADGAVIDHEIQVPEFTDVSARSTGRA